MAKELYLAIFKTETRGTGETPVNRQHMRLVWAENGTEAEHLIREEYETRTSFGGTADVYDLDVNCAIGSPE